MEDLRDWYKIYVFDYEFGSYKEEEDVCLCGYMCYIYINYGFELECSIEEVKKVIS